MIKLYAMVEEEGTAIIETRQGSSKKFYLVKLPYQEGNIVKFDEKNLDSAVCKSGFNMAETGREFENYKSLFEFLNRKVRESANKKKKRIPTQEELNAERKEVLEGII